MQRVSIPELPSERFDVHALLGSGASGHVIDAYDRLRRTRVAVKTLAQRTGAEADALRREFRLAQDLAHPNLAQLGEFLPLDNGFCFTMELVDGVDFIAWVRAAPARLRPALMQLTRGLRALHTAGILHRDIKPSNVLVAQDGRVVILDFGIAEHADATGSLERSSIGTPLYAAPEQCAGERCGPEVDWYAVGALLFHALTGRAPFVGDAFEVLAAKASQSAPRVASLAPDAPEDLARLCDALLQQDPAARPDGDAVACALGDETTVEPVSSDAFVGRTEELARLRTLLAESRRELRSIVLRGQSGVGKSRLLRAFAETPGPTGERIVVLRGRCYEREFVAYKAFIGIVDDLLDRIRKGPSIDDTTRADLADLAMIFPQVRQKLEERLDIGSLAPAEVRENAREQRRVAIDALLRLLAAFALAKPLVLLVDDVQWADEDSIDLLQALLARTPKPRILVVLSERVAAASDSASPLDAHLPEKTPVMTLQTLSPDETEALATSILSATTSLRPEVLLQAVKDSGGNPLLLDELLRGGVQSSSPEAPLRLDDVLRSRADTLPLDARRLLQAICLAGAPIDQAAAAIAAGIDMQALLHVMGLLRGGRFVRAGLRVASDVEPNHDRVREAIVAGLADDERVVLHRALAGVLETAHDVRAEAIAMHWIAAGEEHKGVAYLKLGAEQAIATLAFTRAAELFRTALSLAPQHERTALRRGLVDALTSAGRESEAADERLVLASECDPEEAASERRRAAEQLLRCGRHGEGLAVLRASLATARFTYPESTALLIVLLVFMRLRLTLRGVELKGTARADSLTVLRSDTARSAASGLALSDTIRGAYFQTWALVEALAAGDFARTQYALCMEICFLATGAERNFARTARYLEAAQTLADRIATPGAHAMVSCARGYRAYFAGRWLEAREALVNAETTLRNRCPTLVFEANAMRYNLYRTLTFLGDYNELRLRVPAALGDAVERGDRLAEMNFRSVGTAQIALADDDVDRARSELEATAAGLVRDGFHIQHFAHMVSAVCLDLYENRPQEAAERLAVARSAMRRSLLGRLESLRISLLDIDARVALSLVAKDPSARHRAQLERAVRHLGKQRPPWAQALAALRNAGWHQAEGHADTAIRYREAARLLETQGMVLYAASARLRAADLLGGAEGDAVRAHALAAMDRQGVRRVERFAHLHAPSPAAVRSRGAKPTRRAAAK